MSDLLRGYDGSAYYWCTECGCLVAVFAAETHEGWHQRVDRLEADLDLRETESRS